MFGDVEVIALATMVRTARLWQRYHLCEDVLDRREDEDFVVLDAVRLIVDERAQPVTQPNCSLGLHAGFCTHRQLQEVHGHVTTEADSLTGVGVVDWRLPHQRVAKLVPKFAVQFQNVRKILLQVMPTK